MQNTRTVKGYRYLFVTLLALLVVYPILGSVEWVRPWADILVYVVMVAGVLVARSHHGHRIAIAILGIFTFVSLYLAEIYAIDLLDIASYVLGISFFGYLAAYILRDIFLGRPRVTGEVIYAALAVYLLIGVAFAFAYQLFDFLNAEAFKNTGLLAGDSLLVFEGFLYFSFVTMTTLGFGDITPHTPQAGAFVTAQAVIGQMYLAVLVARLVSLQISHQLEATQ